jgi:hypothetical protein
MSESKHHEESEEQLVSRAQEAVSLCRWVVGECASKWTQRYARGRTDGDFAVLIGLSGDQVYQRRRVWESFAPLRDEFSTLKWSHFYAALNWDDARDCLSWAEETRSTVAEMRAWRRAQRGEDLSVDPVEEEAVRYVPAEPEFVRDAEHADGSTAGGSSRSAGDQERTALAGVARQGGAGQQGNGTEGGEEYAPFRTGAGGAAPRTGTADRPFDRQTGDSEPPSTEQLTKRLTSTLERFVKMMTPEFRREYRKLPPELKDRFTTAVQDLRDHVAELK